MASSVFNIPAELINEADASVISRNLKQQILGVNGQRGAKRQRTSSNGSFSVMNESEPDSSSTSSNKDFVLFRNTVDLTLPSHFCKEIASTLLEATGGDKVQEGSYKFQCKYQVNNVKKQLKVVTASKTVLEVDLKDYGQLLNDFQLYTSIMSNRRLLFSGSPLKMSNYEYIVHMSSVSDAIKLESQCQIVLDISASLPSSAMPSIYATELTVHPLFGQLLHRAFPSLPIDRISRLIPAKEQRSYPTGATRANVKVTPVQFYQAICNHKFTTTPPIIQHPKLTTSLLDYQRESVQWCLEQEGKRIVDGRNLVDVDEQTIKFPPWGWSEITSERGSCWIAPELGLICNDEAQLRADYLEVARSGAKALLAEEMGLGKSLETIALILLNRRPEADIGQPAVDLYSGDTVTKVRTTLIISPVTIQKQWIEEMQKHAPTLTYFVYKGAWNQTERVSADILKKYDVVFTTYTVIARELHYTQKLPSRSMRSESKYEVFRSPLIQLEFWRVMLDEVQLVENGVGNAAQVARTIPRFHAWGVSGTAIRNELLDLAGLLQFLRFIPYIFGHQSLTWGRLCNSPTEFCSFFNQFSIRHTKDMVKDSIDLPPQRRIVLTIPFSTVEENNYRHLFQEFLDDCGFKPDGTPSREGWDPADELPKMSKWLGRLRQTCCHPQIGTGNRRALGGGPLRTVNDVLEAMHENALSQVLSDERLYWSSKIQRGQVLEQDKHPEEALAIWAEALEGIRSVLTACRKQLNEEIERQEKFKVKSESQSKTIVVNQEPVEVTLEEQEERQMHTQLNREELESHRGRVQSARSRIRVFLELEHRCLFFVASVHFQLEHKELEDEYYSLAEKVRRELLQESEQKAQRLMNTLASMAEKQDFAVIPEIESVEDPEFGIESRSIVSRFRELSGILNEQAGLLDEWREKVVSLLSQNLVDRDAEPDGEEYGESLDAQEECFSYQEAIRQVLADRNEAVNGVRNNLVEYDIERENQLDKRTEMAKMLVDQRKKVKPSPELGNFKLVHDEMRRLVMQLSYEFDDAIGATRHRFQMELEIASLETEKVRRAMVAQKKCLDQLNKEQLFFRSIYNARIEYYKQLQQISDGVAEFVPKDAEKYPKTALARENKILSRIEASYARLRYLDHLGNSVKGNAGTVPESERTCVICQSTFEIGSLTVCGHQYCRDCMLEWWKFHKSCPICKRNLKARDIYNISYKPAEIRVNEEKTHSTHHSNLSRAIYSDMSELALDKIKAIELSGSYGSKIDMLLRHMLWLKENEPNVQVVVFSQFTEFLNLVGMAMLMHGVRYASTDRNMDEFKRDSDVTCFLLHAKSQSAGLTLINATHVILCEPLFNTALELQAISRVHRIGQTRPTTVWMYAIDGTVEESVLSLTTKRRLALLRQTDGTNSGGTTPSRLTEAKLDISNSIELQKASGRMVSKRDEGEVVPQEELWDLFFGDLASVEVHKGREMLSMALSGNDSDEVDPVALEYRRFMAEDAAKQRIREKQDE
ncbi:SNF2 family N-terminal domain-containing protein [Lipomyces arxii]|uniref:SNF2 family N-terminal domain-containing protein n=1 Tax=Lipomyces arxii TaxID=56418 RepID=UPI0034CE75A5